MRPSDLDPERWRQIDAVFDAALDTPPEQRDAFLAKACSGDDALRAEVEALLEAHALAGAEFEEPVSPLGAAVIASVEGFPADRQVGPFRLLEEIGRGGMGVVYLAEDTRLGRLVALKALPPYLGVGPETRQRFASEARAVAALDHPNIATLFEIDTTDDGQLYMAFAYYEGETLAARIARGPLPAADAVEIASRIAEGLSVAHRAGIVHRDVKPSNVLLTETGEVKLLDFGVAKVAGEDVTRDGGRLGTVAYMSPEQAGGTPVDRRTDLWSLGVVLYEMLAGKRPFAGADQQSLIQSIRDENPEPLSTLPDELSESVETVVEKLLCKTPDGRYDSAEDTLLDLNALHAGAPPSVAIREPPSPLRATPTRRRRMSAALLTLVVLMGGAWVISRVLNAGDTQIERIAVLPLTNLTGDPDKRYLVDGVHEALIVELGGIGAIDVVSRRSVMRYRDTGLSIPEIAAELDVNAVIEGSVLRGDDSLVITTQLVGVAPEQQLWSERFHRGAEGVFEITGEVARAVADEIELELDPAVENRLAADRRVNPEANDAYLRGRFYLEQGGRPGYDLARRFFQRALEIDPEFAPALAGLARATGGAAIMGAARPSESFPRVRAYTEEALRIDPNLTEAHLYMAAVQLYYDWDWDGAERAVWQVIELNPSHAEAHRRLAESALVMGRHEESLAAARRALDLDRLSVRSAFMLVFLNYLMRDFDAAIEQAHAALDLHAGHWQLLWMLCMSLAADGVYDESIAACEESLEGSRRNPIAVGSLAYVYGIAGRPADAERLARELEERAEAMYVGGVRIAMAYAGLGDRDRAFAWLDRAYADRDPMLIHLRDWSFFDPLRSDSRFTALLDRMGFQTQSGDTQ